MSERAEQMKKLRSQGATYEEIGKAMGISRQRVYQIIGGSVRDCFKEITADECICPNIRKWMNENRISKPKLTRMIYGEERYHPLNWGTVGNILKGSDCHKHCIDNILRVTGLSYEVAFKKEGAAE